MRKVYRFVWRRCSRLENNLSKGCTNFFTPSVSSSWATVSKSTPSRANLAGVSVASSQILLESGGRHAVRAVSIEGLRWQRINGFRAPIRGSTYFTSL